MLRHHDFELAGRVPEPDGEGFAGGSACGDRVRITLALGADGTIAAARFGAAACAHATAAAAWACRRSQGRAFLDAARASLADCAEELGLTGHARDCAAVALDALHAALGDAAERALALMVERARTRVAFGGPLADQGVVQQQIAESRLEIEQARLICHRACHVIDTEGNKAARTLVDMAEVAVPRAATRVIDRAIQVHGGAGVTDVTPLAAMYGWHRAMRLFDGPDEVHLRSIARAELGSAPLLPPHLAPARG